MYFFFTATMNALLRFGEPSQCDVFDAVLDSNELMLNVLTYKEIEVAYKTLDFEKIPPFCFNETRPDPSKRYRGLVLHLNCTR